MGGDDCQVIRPAVMYNLESELRAAELKKNTTEEVRGCNNEGC